MKLAGVGVVFVLICVVAIPFGYFDADPSQPLSSRPEVAAAERDALLVAEATGGRVDALQAEENTVHDAIESVETRPVWSPTFSVRHATFGFPKPVRDAPEIVACTVFNPDALELSEEEMADLTKIISSANERLHELQQRSGKMLVDWSREKVVVHGEGQDLSGDVVRPPRNEDCFVGTYTSADEDIPDQLVVIYPNEFPLLDGMFNDCWLELDIAHDQISSFFTGLR